MSSLIKLLVDEIKKGNIKLEDIGNNLGIKEAVIKELVGANNG